MKGLEISRRFFTEWGLPWLRREYPELVGRIAAGRTGGSDVIGADDAWSQDHDWGPQFHLWLTASDYRRRGRRLAQHINAESPKVFLGARYHFFGRPKDNILVEAIDSFFEWHVGRSEPPKRPRDWFVHRRGGSLVDREAWLYFIRHGEIFHDPLGAFTTRQAAFAHYPRDVRLKVMQQQCTTLWYVADYKFRRRLVYRADPYPFHFAVSQTVEAAMKLCFYLHDDYAPHWQWLHHQFEKLPEAKVLGPILDRFLAGKTPQAGADVVQGIIDFLTQRLAEEGWIAAGHSDIQRAADELKAQIAERAIREAF